MQRNGRGGIGEDIMATNLQIKIRVASVAELKAVCCKLFSLGYGIGSNREQNFWNSRWGHSHYNSVLTYPNGMILFGTPAQGFSRDSFDTSENTAVDIADFLA